jgi:hypothetical protein
MAKVNERHARLIQELETERRKFSLVCLVVGFDSRTELIFGNDQLGLRKLDAFVKDQGEPIGFIGFHREKGVVKIYVRTLSDHPDQGWAENFLDCSLLKAFRAAKRRALWQPKERIMRTEGWRYKQPRANSRDPDDDE